MTETAALLSALRERGIRLWIEHDQLKGSVPAGAVDAEMQAALSNRKEGLLTLLRQNQPDIGVTMSINRDEEISPTLLPTVSRQVPIPIIPCRHGRMTDFIQTFRNYGCYLASCDKGDKSAWRFGVVNFRRSKTRSGWKEVTRRGRFFPSDESPDVIPDHDAY